jgi:hypothetical protein
MDARQFNQQMDQRLDATGLVDEACFFQLADAYSYDAATSVSWVHAKLRVLAQRLARGEPLELYKPQSARTQRCATIEALQAWVSAHFPGMQVASVGQAT